LPGVQWQTPIVKLITEDVRIIERRRGKENGTKNKLTLRQTDERGDQNLRKKGEKGKGKLLERWWLF